MTETVGKSEGISLKGNGIILVDLAAIAMMVMFIEIMLVPALPNIAKEFPGEAQWISWVLSAYMLVGAVATPLLGRLGDIYGKKKVMLIAMIIYTLGLLGCAISWSITSLIIFRAIQGVGLGMFPLAFGIVRDTFPKKQIPMAIGIISAMFSVGVSIGFVGGGYIVSAFSWRDCFYIVIPALAIMTGVAYVTIKGQGETRQGSLDLLGAGLLGGGIFCLLFSLTQGEKWGWTSAAIIGLFLLCIIFLASFILWEKRAKDPIMSLRLLCERGILGANVAALFVGLTLFLFFQTLPFFLMGPVQYGGFGLTDTFTVGLYMLPSAVAQLIFAPLAGKMARKVSADKILAVGLAVTVIGYVFLILMHAEVWQVLLAVFVTGAGLGVCMVSLINVVALSSPQKDFGVASGMNTLFRIVGGSIGPVLAAVIMASYQVGWKPSPFGPTILVTTETGFIMAWIVGGIFALIGLLFVLVLRPGKDITFDAPGKEA
ncbi:MAG: MFS transporter [Methanomassiliicoccales archaeon]